MEDSFMLIDLHNSLVGGHFDYKGWRSKVAPKNEV
jgi:hypothetical protein